MLRPWLTTICIAVHVSVWRGASQWLAGITRGIRDKASASYYSFHIRWFYSFLCKKTLVPFRLIEHLAHTEHGILGHID